MVETSQAYCDEEAVTIEELDKKELNRVKCPECDYKMPVFYTDTAECNGVMVLCKGRKCHSVFELKIKNGKQIR